MSKESKEPPPRVSLNVRDRKVLAFWAPKTLAVIDQEDWERRKTENLELWNAKPVSPRVQ
jgi:hypothetical protein